MLGVFHVLRGLLLGLWGEHRGADHGTDCRPSTLRDTHADVLTVGRHDGPTHVTRPGAVGRPRDRM